MYMPRKVPPKMQAKAAKDISKGVMAVFCSSRKSNPSLGPMATALDFLSTADQCRTFFTPDLIEINLALDRA